MSGPPRTPGENAAGAVAEETLRLVEALAGLAGGVAERPSTTAPTGSSADSRDESVGETEAGTSDHAGADQPGGESPEREAPRAAPAAAACSCHDSSATEAICRVCPICRVAGIVAAIRPDTLERVADLLGMVAGSLQTVAADRRSATSGETGSAADERHTAAPAPGSQHQASTDTSTDTRASEADRDEVVEVVDGPDEEDGDR